MAAYQMLQGALEGLKSIYGYDLCVADINGNIIAGTFALPPNLQIFRAYFGSLDEKGSCVDNYWMFRFTDKHNTDSVVIVAGSDEAAHKQGQTVMLLTDALLDANKERYDKENFIKNLLLDNLLLVDVFNNAKKLNMDTSARRIVYLAAIESVSETNALETVKGLFDRNKSIFVTAVDEKSIILLKEVKPNETSEDFASTAYTVLDTLNTEAMVKVNISYGTVVNELKDVSRSYKEAKMALDVGKIFYSGQAVVAYSSLGIGRLIYQLPLPLCKMFIKEIFENKSPDEFDDETITTINKFFENNLNVSETSRQLYLHRNTLVYRLDKLLKNTGLDIRTFDDAITFKISLMVVKYMKYVKNME